MTEEEKKAAMKNCYNGLSSLNTLIDSMLKDDRFFDDENLRKTKKEVVASIESLGNMLDKNEGKTK